MKKTNRVNTEAIAKTLVGLASYYRTTSCLDFNLNDLTEMCEPWERDLNGIPTIKEFLLGLEYLKGKGIIHDKQSGGYEFSLELVGNFKPFVIAVAGYIYDGVVVVGDNYKFLNSLDYDDFFDDSDCLNEYAFYEGVHDKLTSETTDIHDVLFEAREFLFKSGLLRISADGLRIQCAD